MDIAARIRAVGESAGRTDSRKRSVCKVKCQGCGKEIFSDDALLGVEYAGYVEYVKTKRGTEFFLHHGCIGEVWKHGIV